MRSLQNTAMHLRKTCNHPYLFLEPSYTPLDPLELIKASGKLELLDRILPKLQATGSPSLRFLRTQFQWRHLLHLRLY